MQATKDVGDEAIFDLFGRCGDVEPFATVLFIRERQARSGILPGDSFANIGESVRIGAQAHRSVVEQNAGTERSEEHTSELQSLMRISYAVFCLKKKNKQNTSSKFRLIT